MKRREFLIGSASVIGSALPGVAGAASRPCPPATVRVTGGNQVSANCTNATAEQDWLDRATAASVLWAHDFRQRAEVDNFRQSQDAVNLEGQLVKQGRSTDKAGLGYHTCLWGTDSIPGTNGKSLLTFAPKAFGPGKYFESENSFSKSIDLSTKDIYSKVGASPIRLTSQQLCFLEMIGGGGWNRPFAPVEMKDGSLPPDRARNDSVPRVKWDPNDVYQFSYFTDTKRGFFVHRDYASAAQYSNGEVLGNEFWLQFRVKMSAGRFDPRDDVSGLIADNVVRNSAFPNSYGKQFPPPGKLAFIHKPKGAEQEIVPISGQPDPEWFYPNTYPFRWYGKYGEMSAQFRLDSNPQVTSIQPASPWERTCALGADVTKPDSCWFWPVSEWVTVLVHIRPGRQNTRVDGGNNDTLIEFKVARWGETSYTTVYRANRGLVYSEDGMPFGFSLLSLNCYFNNVPSFRHISHTYSQIVLSSEEIPCPQVY
jgi:hypothetical protein